MNGLLIFNSSNDVIFRKFNKSLDVKLKQIAKLQGLLNEDASSDEEENLDNNIILQIFSPLINSQKIMFCQFDNTYSSFQCEEGVNFAFGDFLGYTFIKIGSDIVEKLRRNIGVCISFAKHLCGPNLYLLQANDEKNRMLTKLLENYEDLYDTNQMVLLEALPQLLINGDLKTTITKIMGVSLDKLKDIGFERAHTLMFVQQKFTGIYSTPKAIKLSASDILFTTFLHKTLQAQGKQCSEFYLQGERSSNLYGCIPMIMQSYSLDKGVVLLFLVEYGNPYISSSLFDSFFVIQKVLNIQMQGDLDNLKPCYDNLETYAKQTLEALRKAKLKGIDLAHKKFASKWENLKKLYSEFFKTSEKDLVLRIESNIPGFQEDLKELFRLTSSPASCALPAENDLQKMGEIATIVEERLLEFAEFLSVKAERNIMVESYLEEFPGLVHFIFIDRSNGTMIAPDLPTETKLIPKEKIWTMVEFSRSYLRDGHTRIMWKDPTFHYSYFLWFEEKNNPGTAMKHPDFRSVHMAAVTGAKPKLEPGVLTGSSDDFYQSLMDISFPKSPPNKIKCYELYCIHLGLVTATCAVEHCRRLVATISDITGES